VSHEVGRPDAAGTGSREAAVGVPAPSAAIGAAQLLRNPGFVGLLVYRLLGMLSYQIVAVTVGWHVYEITHDPLALGLIGLTEVIPYFCFALFAGYAVDHLPRRKLGLFACLGLMLTTLMLAGVAGVYLPAGAFGFGTLTIYAAIAINGVVRAFLAPVYMSLFARVLKREHYARGAGVSSVVMQTGLVLGPAMGGALVAWGGKTSAYLVAAGFALAAAVAIISLRVTEPPAPAERAPVFKSIGEGLRFVFNNQVVLGAQALDMFSVLFGGAVALLPAFINDILHYGPEALGVLRAAPAAGAVLIGLWLARHPPQKNAGRLLLYAVAGFGLCIIGFALSRQFWLSAAMLMLSGMCDGVSVVLRSTILQLSTPDEMRGRVSSINGIFIGSSNELGAFESGVAARLMGLVPSVIFGGCMTLAVVGATAKLAPKLRRLDLRDLQ
jgi:MFS family permease